MDKKPEKQDTANSRRIDLYFNLSHPEQKKLYEQMVELKKSMGVTYTQAVLVITGQEQVRDAFQKLSEEYEELKLLFAQKEYQLIKLRAQTADRYLGGESIQRAEPAVDMEQTHREEKDTLAEQENRFVKNEEKPEETGKAAVRAERDSLYSQLPDPFLDEEEFS